jgi:hypothetical protein
MSNAAKQAGTLRCNDVYRLPCTVLTKACVKVTHAKTNPQRLDRPRFPKTALA